MLVDAEIDDVPAAEPTRVGSRRTLAYLGVCLVLIGLNLRTVFSSFSAVLPEVTADAGLPGWAVVVLTTVPVTLLGVFAPLAPVLARRFGAERVLLGAMAVLTAGLLLRPLDAGDAGHLPALLAGTAACGAAISLCNVLLPGLVKRDFPHRLGLMGGLYTTAICASAALGAGFTYPVFSATGDWTAALRFWALPAGVVLLLVPAAGHPAAPRPAPAGARRSECVALGGRMAGDHLYGAAGDDVLQRVRLAGPDPARTRGGRRHGRA